METLPSCPLPDVALPNGSVVPGESLGPCAQCGQAVFEVVHRWVQVRDPQNRPTEMELVSCQCPRCCWVRAGSNQHGRKERRTRLYWLDQATGRPLPTGGYSLAESAIPAPILPLTQDEDCPAWAFDARLAIPARPAAPAGPAGPSPGAGARPAPAARKDEAPTLFDEEEAR